MINLDKMKKGLIKQIENMTVEEYYEFTRMPEEKNDFSPGFISENGIFSCDNCRKTYGNCSDIDSQSDICFERYKKYAMSES